MNHSNHDSSGEAGPGPSTTANARRRSTVTTTIVNSDGSDAARIGACSNCRSRKIKCSGDKPVCKMCAKYSQECEYPIHVSRKRKDRDPRTGRAEEIPGSHGKARNSSKRRTTATEAGIADIGGLNVHPAHFEHSPAVDNFFPTLDFTADSVPIHNPGTFDGTLIDDSWLESFLTYDFGSETPTGIRGDGSFPPSSVGNNFNQQSHARLEKNVAPTAGRNGSASHSEKKGAKFRVPYFRSVNALYDSMN